jgi:erythritol kinase
VTPDIVIGVDAGTSVIKSVAFTAAGEQLAVASVPNPCRISGERAEQDMDRTWSDVAATLRMLVDRVPSLPSRTAAVAVTGQGDGTWLVDRAGVPVAPALLWLDARAAGIVEEMRASETDPRRFALTGTGLGTAQQGPQLVWLKRHAGALLAAAATAFHCKDWLYFKLAGEHATDPSEASLSFGDFRTRAYSDEVVEALGLGDLKRLLPEIVDGIERRSRLIGDAARATGLLSGTPVVLGYIDIVCSALGTGLVDGERDVGCSVLGSTGMHIRLSRSPERVVLNAARSGYTMPFPVPGALAQAQSNLSGTLNIDWMVDFIGGILDLGGTRLCRGDILARLDDLVRSAAPASLLYHPYISDAGERGPFVDSNSRAGFLGLARGHGCTDLVRAVYEGLAFAARDCYVAMGEMPCEVRVSGGAARSRTLRSILAAALGVPIRTSRREQAGAAGAAMIAAVSLGVYGDMDACVADWVRPLLGEAEAPDPELSAIYRETFPTYVAAREAMGPLWKAMAAHRTRPRRGADA